MRTADSLVRATSTCCCAVGANDVNCAYQHRLGIARHIRFRLGGRDGRAHVSGVRGHHSLVTPEPKSSNREAAMTDESRVLMIGATGRLGGQVVDALLRRGKRVRALVRPGSDTRRLEANGVEIVRGDMLDRGSLRRAMDGADSVITTAAGYTRRQKGATEIDTVGNANLAAAASQAGVRRYVLTSILTCDQTPNVSHFWNKKLAEDHLEELGVPFVALRPGSILDLVADLRGDPFAKGRFIWLGSTRVPLTFVLAADLADYLAAAVDAAGVEGQRIDIGWNRPVSLQDIAEISGHLLGRKIRVRSIPNWPIRAHRGRNWLGRADGEGHGCDGRLVRNRQLRRRYDSPSGGVRSGTNGRECDRQIRGTPRTCRPHLALHRPELSPHDRVRRPRSARTYGFRITDPDLTWREPARPASARAGIVTSEDEPAVKQLLRLGLSWVVEGANSWLSNYGQLRRNADRRTKHRHAQLCPAALLITVNLINWQSQWSPDPRAIRRRL